MDQLQGEMEYGEDDFAGRLGRKKPDLEVVKIEGDMPLKSKENMEEMMGKDLDSDMEMDENHDRASMMLDGDDPSPEDELKKRLMKLRG